MGSHVLDDQHHLAHGKINMRICRIRCKEILFPAHCYLLYFQLDFLQVMEDGFGQGKENKIKRSCLISQRTKQSCTPSCFACSHEKLTEQLVRSPSKGNDIFDWFHPSETGLLQEEWKRVKLQFALSKGLNSNV